MASAKRLISDLDSRNRIGAVKEKDVGITEFASEERAAFYGLVKERYSDFMVHEIDLDGNVVRLTDFTLPPLQDDARDDSLLSEDTFIELIGGNEIHAKLLNFESPVETAVIADKDKRNKVHQYIKVKFPVLTSSTNADKEILISTKKSSDFSYTPPFCGFHLYKENMDTMEAVGKLASLLHLPVSLFKYAGTKDKRAITVQKIVVAKVRPDKIAKINEMSNVKMKVGNFSLPKSSIGLGDLKGNRFTIVLRSLNIFHAEAIEKRFKSFIEKGFINYFGLQRFGTSSISTHEIGMRVVKSQWKEAVELIMAERPTDSLEIKKAKQYWADEQSVDVCLSAFPKRYQTERAIITALSKQPQNYCTAFQAIPRNLRQMYGHSFQSYVWNLAVSERIKIYGFVPVIGDLVLKDEKAFNAKNNQPLYIESDEDLKKFSIYDVVLPLPGYDIFYPKADPMKQFYEHILTDFDTSGLSNKIHKELSLHGAYRKIMSKPSNVEWRLQGYSDLAIPLVKTDLKCLQNDTSDLDLNSQVFETELNEMAMIINFDLETSQYATMALRELMKGLPEDYS